MFPLVCLGTFCNYFQRDFVPCFEGGMISMKVGFSIGLFKSFRAGGNDVVLVPDDAFQEINKHLSVLMVEARENGARLKKITAECRRVCGIVDRWQRVARGFPGGAPPELQSIRERHSRIPAPLAHTRNQLQEKAILLILDCLMQRASLRKTGEAITRERALNAFFRIVEAAQISLRWESADGRRKRSYEEPLESIKKRLIRNQRKAWDKLKDREPLTWDDFRPPVEIVSWEHEDRKLALTFRSQIGAWVPVSKAK